MVVMGVIIVIIHFLKVTTSMYLWMPSIMIFVVKLRMDWLWEMCVIMQTSTFFSITTQKTEEQKKKFLISGRTYMYIEGVWQSTEGNVCTYGTGSNRRMEKVAQREHLVWSWLLKEKGCKKYTPNFVADSDKPQYTDSLTPSCCNVANFRNSS